jgi:ribosomal protein S18 acetylase RimI-like enzyme
MKQFETLLILLSLRTISREKTMSTTQFDINLMHGCRVTQPNVMVEGNPLTVFSEIQPVEAILARAFVDDPMFEFTFPDPTTRLQALTAFFQPFVVDGNKRGNIVLAPANQGACIWYSADVPLIDDAFEAALGEVIAIASHYGGTESAQRFEHLATQVTAHEPTDPRYEVLWIALFPEARGRGLGGQLLQPVLTAADAQGTGSYVVSSNIRNHSFYMRHGFRKQSSIAISPHYSMTGMWRVPNSIAS